MGQIGRWIDKKCCTDSEHMRGVMERRWGPLEQYIGGDRKCGCLIGSYRLERASWLVKTWPGDLDKRIRSQLDTEERTIGVKVWWLTLRRGGQNVPIQRRRSDAFVIKLLKQRIRKALGLSLIEHRMAAHEEHAPQQAPA